MKLAWRAWIERAVIALGLLSFWPWIFGHSSVWYQCALVLVLIALAALAVVRFMRVKQGFESQSALQRDEPASDRRVE